MGERLIRSSVVYQNLAMQPLIPSSVGEDAAVVHLFAVSMFNLQTRFPAAQCARGPFGWWALMVGASESNAPKVYVCRRRAGVFDMGQKALDDLTNTRGPIGQPNALGV